MGRDRPDEGGSPPPAAYRMRQRLIAIGEDFWIETGAGERLFRIDSAPLRARRAVVVEAADGRPLYTIQQQPFHLRDTTEIAGTAGRVATVRKAIVTPLREQYTVELDGGGEWTVEGDPAGPDYAIHGPGGTVAAVGRTWFPGPDSYGVVVGAGQDDALVLAVAVIIDHLSQPDH